jgi:lipoate-protein ligase A
MSSEVSRRSGIYISGLRGSQRFLDSARTDKAKEATRCFFTALTVYHDTARSAAMNMAIDEALLEHATDPLIRFYRWQSPALSFGYFGRFGDVAGYQSERDLVRRWTGGGIVFHGKDLTYSIVIPVGNPAFCESSISIYQKIHRALVDVLAKTGQRAVVAGVGEPSSYSGMVTVKRAATSDAGYSCFTSPVLADVMINGRKVAGAAQRRTRRGLLQQGSIQGIDLGHNLAKQFAHALSANCRQRKVGEEVLKLARELAEEKYGNENWLRRH